MFDAFWGGFGMILEDMLTVFSDIFQKKWFPVGATHSLAFWRVTPKQPSYFQEIGSETLFVLMSILAQAFLAQAVEFHNNFETEQQL